MTRACYQDARPDWVLQEPVMDSDWSPCLQILEGHFDEICSIAWSPDGSRLASESNDHTIRVWDSVSGKCISTLKGDSRSVVSIAWTPDGSWLTSGSMDRTVKVCDSATEKYTLTLEVNYPDRIKFDKANSSYLHADVGSFDFASADPIVTLPGLSSALQQPFGYSVNFHSHWITLKGENLLWLPLEYRPSSILTWSAYTSFTTTTVAVGCSSGRVWTLTLRNDPVWRYCIATSFGTVSKNTPVRSIGKYITVKKLNINNTSKE
jgi:WD40 repeat protein